jgi:galactose mutarotase-like enzyme
MQTEIYTEDLFMCIYLWRNVADVTDAAYEGLCNEFQSRLSDEQWHELELVFGI